MTKDIPDSASPNHRCFSVSFMLALCLLGMISTDAHAQSEKDAAAKKSPPHRRIYVAQYTGTTAIGSSDLRLIQPRLGTDVTYRSVNYEQRLRSGSPYYGVKMGYYLPKAPRIGVEFEYNHTKMYAKRGEAKPLTGTWQGQTVNSLEPLAQRIQRYQISNGVNSLSLNLLYHVPVSVSPQYPNGRWQPYFGGGPQYTYLYSINTVDGLRAKEKYHPNGWGYQLIGGIRGLVTPRIGFFAEGKVQRGNPVSLVADKGDAKGGRGTTAIRIKHLALGVFYQF